MSASTAFLIQLILALALAPLLPGIINRVKAMVAGRHGKPLLQTYYDLAKLLGKGEVISRTTTWTFVAAPGVSLAAALCALALLPLGGVPSPLAFGGDFLLAAYLFGMGRFAIMLAALDTGSSFEGMGASREATFSALGEPAFFLAFLTLTSLGLDLGGGTANISGLDARAAFSLSVLFNGDMAALWQAGRPELLLAPAVFFSLLLAENCRIPVDDPTTHLELTMIHEVMVLDHSGPNLAMIVYGATLKLWFFAALVAGLLVPPLPLWQHAVLSLLTILGIGVAVGLVESGMARLRLTRVPHFLGVAAALAALALILTQAR